MREPQPPLNHPARHERTRTERPLRLMLGINSMVASGGSELHAVRLAEGLKARGHVVFCATLASASDGLCGRYEAAGIPLLRYPLPRLVGIHAVRQMSQAAGQIRSLGVEIVHAHDLYMNLFLGVAGRLAGVRSVASKRWAFHERAAHRTTDFVAYRLADRVLANSAWVGRSLTEQDGVAASRVVTVGNFVNPKVFDAKLGRDRWRAHFDFDADARVIGCTAQLRSEKNHALLLESFALLHATDPRTRLLIVGDGPERAALERKAGEHGLTSVVRFAGHVDDAWQATAAMDLFVLLSKHEGFPNALLEAMAIGVPVAATAVGGIPDLVSHNVTGILLTRQTASGVADDLRRTLHSDEARLAMAASARSFVREHHTEARVLDLHEDLYFNLLGTPHVAA